jgi:presequence protease
MVYSKAKDWIENDFRNLSDQDLNEAKLDVLKQLDGPLNASQEGVGEFLHGLGLKDKSEFRSRLFNVTLQDIIRVGKTYLIDEKSVDSFIGQGE